MHTAFVDLVHVTHLKRVIPNANITLFDSAVSAHKNVNRFVLASFFVSHRKPLVKRLLNGLAD